MNQIVSTLLKDVVLKRKKDIPVKVVINAIHYIMAVVAGINRCKMEQDGKLFPINYYGITFANSGRGKDLSLDIVKPIASQSVKFYYEKMTEALVNNPDASIPSIEFKEGSTSGFMQDRNFMDIVAIGSTNIRVQELLSTMKSKDFESVINLLIESWQEGANEARAFKSYVSPPIKHVPMNCLLYSSPEGFRSSSNKAFTSFINDLANGLSRRSWIVFDDSSPEIQEMPTLESIKRERDDIGYSDAVLKQVTEHFDDIAEESLEKIIRFSDEAKLDLKTYDVKNKNLTVQNQLMKSAIKAEMGSRAFKVTRLAAMYALFDGSDEVSQENVRDAIEWAEMLNKDLSIVLNAETVQEQIYDYLSKANKYVSETDIRKYLGISATEFRESKDELFSVSYEHGAVLQVKVFDEHGRVIRYNLIHGNETEPNNMICSASNGHKSEGFVTQNIGYKQIPDLLRGVYGKNYSAGTFVDSYRNTNNFIKRSNLIMLDIDDGTTIEDTLLFCSRYRGYISTTRSHQKSEKDGKPIKCQDRFRVVLVSKFEFNLSPDEHKATIKNMANFLGITVDTKAVEVARFYFANPDTTIIEIGGEDLVDLRDYVPETKQQESAAKLIHHVEQQTQRREGYEPNDNINAFDKWALRLATVGSRNNTFYSLFRALQDHKNASAVDAEMKVRELNAMIADPLDESELVSTIFKER